MTFKYYYFVVGTTQRGLAWRRAVQPGVAQTKHGATLRGAVQENKATSVRRITWKGKRLNVTGPCARHVHWLNP